MSDGKFWRIKRFVDEEIESGSFPMHYSELISKLGGSERDTFYLGMVIWYLFDEKKLTWDMKRNLHIPEQTPGEAEG